MPSRWPLTLLPLSNFFVNSNGRTDVPLCLLCLCVYVLFIYSNSPFFVLLVYDSLHLAFRSHPSKPLPVYPSIHPSIYPLTPRPYPLLLIYLSIASYFTVSIHPSIHPASIRIRCLSISSHHVLPSIHPSSSSSIVIRHLHVYNLALLIHRMVLLVILDLFSHPCIPQSIFH